ncbi:MAG: DUF6600 domain-containing protein [Terriglobia bacterium]
MKRLIYILALASLVVLSLTVLAVEPARAEEEEPAPGVARVSLINGDVSAMRGDSGDWVATTVNAPLVHGDKVATGEKSRSEIQLDSANTLRLAASTEVKVADLTRTRIQLQVAQGLVTYSVMKENEADIEIDTPNMAVRPVKEGMYRIEVRSPSETLLIVRKGEADVSTPQGSTTVKEGKLITVLGADNPEYQIASAPGKDDWDKWNKDRDDDIRDARSYRYATRYYTGAQDLDRYGRWVNVPGYDYVWSPYADPNWAPYRSGSWVWEPYWGWTWVSYEPWGWAPYHYGRWFVYGSSWYWWPGHHYYGYYPTWAPAYVSFIGFGFGGHNWSFGFGYGYSSIGWCALGPYDRHYPWWGRHNTYRSVNITNITNVTNVTNINNINGGRGTPVRGPVRTYNSNLQQALTNDRVRRGITEVSTEDFVRGRIPRQAQPVNVTNLRQAQMVQGAVPAVPTRESLRPVDRPVNTAALPRNANAAQNFFTRRQPPAGPQSFTARQAEVRQMVEQRNPNAAEGGRPATAAQASGRVAGNAAVNTERGGAQAGAAARVGASTGGQPAAAGQPNLREAQEALRNRERGTVGARPAGVPAERGNAATGSTTSQPAAAAQPAPNRMEGAAREGAAARGWTRFGQPASGETVRTSPAPVGRQEATPQAAPAQGNRNQTVRPAPQQPQEPRQNWQRFGTGQPRAVPDRPTTTGAPQAARPAPAQRETPAAQSPRQFDSRPAPSQGGGNQSNFQRFGSESRPAPTQREAPAPETPRRFESRPAPSQGGGNQSNFQRFNSEPRPAPAERNTRSFSSGGESQGSGSPGWSRFPSRSEAPRSFERQPLEIRRSITTERAAPRGFEGGASRGGRSVAPSAPSRSFEGGGNRGGGSWGGGRSAPSAPPRSYSGGGGGRQSAPPARSFGGGGGGGRSAPSGGGHSASAPRGGGSNHGRH